MDRATYEAQTVGLILDALLAPRPKAKPALARNSSVQPYVTDDWSPPGCSLEFDYQFEFESPEDMPLVYVTACRFMAHDGTEYPVKLSSLDARWLSGIESLISDEILDSQP